MKKQILLLLFLVNVSIISLGQSTRQISAETYKGYIFDSGYFVFKSIHHQKMRYTPSNIDIAKAERILKQYIKNVNRSKGNQSGDCPRIDLYLKRYTRQYVGFINKKGEKIIWINFFWNKDLEKKAKNGIISVDDGCSYYWNIEVNINKQTLYNLSINGSA